MCSDLDGHALRVEVEAFLAGAAAEDTLVLYLAGHGLTCSGEGVFLGVDYDPRGRGLENADEIPAPTTGTYSAEALWRAIEASPARRVLVVVDACRGGSFDVLHHRLAYRTESVKQVGFLCAAGPDRLALECASGGAFTRRWLAALADPAAADGRGVIDLGRSFARAYDSGQAPRLTGQLDELPLARVPVPRPARASVPRSLDARYELMTSRQVTGSGRVLGGAARILVITVDFGHDTPSLTAQLKPLGKGTRPVRQQVFRRGWRAGECDYLQIPLDQPTRLPAGLYRVELIPCECEPCDRPPAVVEPALVLD